MALASAQFLGERLYGLVETTLRSACVLKTAKSHDFEVPGVGPTAPSVVGKDGNIDG